MFSVEIFVQMFFLLGAAGLGNIGPVVGNKLPVLTNWKTPLDFGLKFKGKRIFGENKTWRGLMWGGIFGGLASLPIIYLINISDYLADSLEFMGHDPYFLILFGILSGIFALLGDALESFFKRQLNIPPGKALPVLDQIDYILGAYILIMLLFDLSLGHYIAGIIIYGVIHPFMSNLGYILRLKKNRF